MDEEDKYIKKVQSLEYIKYDKLREEALEYISKIGGEKWNNFAENDPGITILENLLFAILDLDYRSKFTMIDLLAENPNSGIGHIPFFNPQEILTSAPVTKNDYCKLILDVENVLNCDIIPRENDGEVGGLYDVYLCIEPSEKKTIEKTIERVRELLYKNRNLCEDFNSIQPFENIEVKIEAHIGIKSNVNKEEYKDIVGLILITTQFIFTPKINFQKLSDIFDTHNIENIYNGPLLQHGFITEEELEKGGIKHFFTIPDIIRTLLSIDKIETVSNFSITNIKTGEKYKNFIKTDFNQVVKVVFSESDITLTRDETEIVFKKEETVSYAKRIFLGSAKKQILSDEELTLYSGLYKNLNKYYSIQKDFPLIYGVGEEGPINDESYLQTNNLKCYLLIFDQILNVFLTKLNNFKNIVSINAIDNEETQYTIPEDVPFLENITKNKFNYRDQKKNKKDFFKIQREYLRIHAPEVTQNISSYLNLLLRQLDKGQREKIVDHLLARFSEKIETKSDIKLDKNRFLLNYVDLSYKRFNGLILNNSNFYWEGDNISGFEKRLGLYFNFKNINRRSISLVVDQNIGLWKSDNSDSRSVFAKTFLKEAGEYNSSSFFYRSDIPNFLNLLLKYGEEQKNYKITKRENKVNYSDFIYFEVSLLVGDKEEDKISLESAYGPIKNVNTAHKIIKESIERIQIFNVESEGMHLVEHILLRTGNGVDDINNKDLSFKCSIIFPEWPRKFQDTTFKQEVEEWINNFSPAHIKTNIYWVSLPQMGTFEIAYKNWLEKKNKMSSTKEEIDLASLNLKKILDSF